MSAPSNTPEFRPHQGLMAIGKRLAAGFGVAHLWEGDEGLGKVLSNVLKDFGVSEEPVKLTPLEAARRAGLTGKRRRR